MISARMPAATSAYTVRGTAGARSAGSSIRKFSVPTVTSTIATIARPRRAPSTRCGRDGDETYAPHFTFQGFRYARVTIKGDAKIAAIASIPISSVAEPAGGFTSRRCAGQSLVENTIWSQRSNFIEVPTDCPQRDERLGWTGDAQVFAATACWLHDSQTFLRKYLRDVMADQREDGAVPHFSPDPTRLHPANVRGDYAGSTGWGDAIVVIPWVLYMHYGDRAVLAECLPAMVRWVDFVWSISRWPDRSPAVALGRARLHLRRLAAAGRRQSKAAPDHRRRLRGDALSLHLDRAVWQGSPPLSARCA